MKRMRRSPSARPRSADNSLPPPIIVNRHRNAGTNARASTSMSMPFRGDARSPTVTISIRSRARWCACSALVRHRGIASEDDGKLSVQS